MRAHLKKPEKQVRRKTVGKINHSLVGIEALSVHVPLYCIDLGEVARANRVDPNKYYIGLGQRQMAVAHPQEDSVTMAANAASKLLRLYSVHPEDIGMIVVGTETGVDASKPVAVYVHEMLGLGPACRSFDIKHACYGSTAALKTAALWASSPLAQGRKALVIATDIARYEIGSLAEPTQGAGAVAMIVGREPRILSLFPSTDAVYSRQAMDFWRPNYSEVAIVDGHFSVECYLDALRETYRMHREVSGICWTDYRYLLFHLPFAKMGIKAHRMLMETFGVEGDVDLATWESTSLEKRVVPSLWGASEIGNTYCASLYLALAGILESEESKAEGQSVGLYSYGSGSCAEFFSGSIGPDASAWSGRIGLSEGIASRIGIDYETYLEFERECEARSINGKREGMVQYGRPGEAVFLGVEQHRRYYLPPRDVVEQGKAPYRVQDDWALIS